MKAFRLRVKGTLKKPLGIASLLSILLFTCLVLTIAGVGGYAAQTIFQSKYRDVIGLLGADAERLGTFLQNNIESNLYRGSTEAGARRAPDILMQLSDDGHFNLIQGRFADTISPKEFGIDLETLREKNRPLTLLWLAGETYLGSLDLRDAPESKAASVGHPYRVELLSLWRLPVKDLTLDEKRFSTQSTIVYLVTRQGKMIFGNNASITSQNFSTRPAVRNFLESPLSRGYTNIETDNNPLLAAFYEIPRSNLILFVETHKDAVLADLSSVVQHALMIFFLILLFSLVLLQFPLRKIIGPIADLVAQAEQVSRGNFQLKKVIANGAIEVRQLSTAFATMCESLERRDEQIRILADQEVQRVQLQNEVEVAQNIQNNLLPTNPRLTTPKLSIEAVYRPASLCAGDWYFMRNLNGGDKTVFVIADVSGHGVGSSMFTAIIAGLFNLYLKKVEDSWTLKEFADEVNTAIFDLGKSKWHVSLIIGVHHAARETIDLQVCGHVPAVFTHLVGEKWVQKFLQAPSDLLGLAPDANTRLLSLPFPPGSSLFLYTDGLTEAQNQLDKPWGNRKLSQTLQSIRPGGKKPNLSQLLLQWDEFRSERQPEDDVCILSLYAS